MNRARDKFLSGSGFALNQHGRVRGSGLCDELRQFGHGRTAAGEVVTNVEILFQLGILRLEPFDQRSVLECDRGYRGDSGQQFEMSWIESRIGIRRVR